MEYKLVEALLMQERGDVSLTADFIQIIGIFGFGKASSRLFHHSLLYTINLRPSSSAAINQARSLGLTPLLMLHI
ncbi:hypothetical protein LC653_32830 [Nostoc sp. CHAB 5784]|uniref:hypothetical protein n=1 Tax=Nostoc mirabile TaxID=2907820 RepID=UPI001E50754C|nr:hypothetical protein [Nostoc mirabile]MCC5668506.1 hypothetical protein [Nostoc mirabile CHAB5784]